MTAIQYCILQRELRSFICSAICHSREGGNPGEEGRLDSPVKPENDITKHHSYVSRLSTALAWASSPSALARVCAAGPSFFSRASSTLIRLVSLTKSVTLSGEVKRAVPPVGKTWLGPAM